ncbi:helix-turn-helix domain-containing protein [Microbacterium sp. SA39]|uniref:helix-turn-helix domain-containing protein n=1 Tax=Microbacterium sp. SA39 TaxID=1263625 RepID=UPI00061E3268|nr:helix-turn-helix transcriptional regulator [Microbacterium sp. SA39]KJQ53719.1 hypothetical protein RS85_02269 [Microbacterium sp. SA39]
MSATLIQEVVGRNVRHVRSARDGLSQVELGARVADRLGVAAWSSATMSAAENGRREFTAAEIVALAVELGVLPGALLLIPEDIEAVVIGGKRGRGNEVMGGTVVARDAVQPIPHETEGVDRLAQLAADAVSRADALTESLDELHIQAMQLRVQALRHSQGSTPARTADHE